MVQRREQEGRARTRQADIAKAAGLSQATVSMVLSGRPSARISEETRQRILELSGSLGYSANPAARRLAGGKNRILGVFTYEPTFPIAGLDQYYPFLLGIEAEAEDLHQNLLLFTSASGKGRARSIYADGVNQLGIADGSILLGRGEDRDEVARLAHEGYPFVYIGRREIKGADISWVTADYESATYEVVSRLAALGHRRLLYVGVTDPEEPNIDRFAGFSRAVEEYALETTVIRPADDADVVEQIGDELKVGATAIVIETPEDGARVFKAVKALGLDVPGQVSVAVLGDMAIPRARKQTWSGFGMPFGEIGAEAVRVLAELIIDPSVGPRHVKLPCNPRPGRTIGEASSGRQPTTQQ
ncbi:LacI family DNA-binding transcriptional regulator [Georgenia halophila]|uniref:LacI family DNA-binding transcriptional regulator n=1 Tax=Georgenia halophila TaxID=620889 RepID=A0ABP8LKH5_9MICO